VVAVEGERITDGIALIVSIRTHQPGETIEFTYRRGDDERTTEITLDAETG
jgi:putative serine protease PepD